MASTVGPASTGPAAGAPGNTGASSTGSLGASAVFDPQRIEEEIARARERQSEPWAAGTRATLFNLLVVRASPENRGRAPDGVEDAISFLLGKRPARILTISLGGGSATEVVVSSRCHPDPRGRGVCLEQIDIMAGSDRLGADPGLWAPLLVADIPTHLWWAAPPVRLHPLPALAVADIMRGSVAQTDKLIIDSARASDPLQLLADLARVRESSSGAVAVADLAWGRLQALRAHAARAFDPPEARPLLGNIATIRLEGGARAEALLVFLWVAARLGWRATGETPSGLPRLLDSEGNEVALEHLRPGRLAEGARLAFGLRGVGSPATIAIVCTREGCAQSGTEQGVWRVGSDGELLLAELDSLFQDETLEEVVRLAARLREDERPASQGQAAVRWPALGDEGPLTVTPSASGREPGEQRRASIETRVYASPEDLAASGGRFLFDRIRGALGGHGAAVVALAGRDTPRASYCELARLAREQALAVERIVWLIGDERWVPVGHHDSNEGMAREELLGPLGAPEHAIVSWQAGWGDPVARAADYAMRLASIGPPDLVILGIGEDGHTASLFAGAIAWLPGGERLPVSPELPARAAAIMLADGATWRLTLCPNYLTTAQCVVFLAAGERKHDAVARAVAGDPRTPAAWIRGAETFLLADRAAAPAPGNDGGSFRYA